MNIPEETGRRALVAGITKHEGSQQFELLRAKGHEVERRSRSFNARMESVTSKAAS